MSGDVRSTLADHCTAFVGHGLEVRMNRVLPGEPVLRHAHAKAHATVITGHVIAKCDRGDFELCAGEGHVAVFIVAPGEAHELHAVTPSAYACVGMEGFDR